MQNAVEQIAHCNTRGSTYTQVPSLEKHLMHMLVDFHIVTKEVGPMDWVNRLCTACCPAGAPKRCTQGSHMAWFPPNRGNQDHQMEMGMARVDVGWSARW